MKDEESYTRDEDLDPVKNFASLQDHKVIGLRVTERLHRAYHERGKYRFFDITRSEKNNSNGESKQCR